MSTTMSNDLKFRVLAQVTGAETVDKFGKQITNLEQQAEATQKKFSALATGVQALLASFVVTKVFDFAKDILNTADNLHDLSQKTGVSVKELAGFKTAAENSGVGIEGLANGIKKLQVNTIEAVTGNKKAQGAFESLGISVKDAGGRTKQASELIKEISDKFSNMKDGSEKAAIAVKIFGKAGADLIPFLNEGSASMTKFGLAINDDFAARADAFNDSLVIMKVNLQNVVAEGISAALPAFQEIINAFSSQKSSGPGFVTVLFRDIGELAKWAAATVNGLYDAFVILSDFLVTSFRFVGGYVTDIFKGIATLAAESAKILYKAATGHFQEAADLGKNLGKSIVTGIKSTFTENNDLFGDFLSRSGERLKQNAKVSSKLFKNSIFSENGVQNAAADTAPKVRSTTPTFELDKSKLQKEETDKIKDFIDQQKLENQQRRATLGDINLTTLELKKLTEARKVDTAALAASKSMTAEQKAKLTEATKAIKAERAELVELDYQTKRTFEYGAKDALRSYVTDVTDAANNTKKVFATAFSALEDTLSSFVETGKLNFRNFATSVLKELERIAIRQAVIAPLANAFLGAIGSAASKGAVGASAANGGSGYYAGGGGSSTASYSANGNVVTKFGPMPLRKYANGGVANSPHVAVFGEGSKPEAFVPLPDGRSIPVTMNAGGSSGDVNVSVSVNVSGSQVQSSAQSDKQTGKELGQMIANAIKIELVNQKRPGGLLAT